MGKGVGECHKVRNSLSGEEEKEESVKKLGG
jgi:hypothetical protein